MPPCTAGLWSVTMIGGTHTPHTHTPGQLTIHGPLCRDIAVRLPQYCSDCSYREMKNRIHNSRISSSWIRPTKHLFKGCTVCVSSTYPYFRRKIPNKIRFYFCFCFLSELLFSSHDLRYCKSRSSKSCNLKKNISESTASKSERALHLERHPSSSNPDFPSCLRVEGTKSL